MIADLFAAIDRSFTLQHVAEYLFVGWLVYGIGMFGRKVTGDNWKRLLLFSLMFWWISLAVYALVALHTAATVVFDPDKGPFAHLVAALREIAYTRRQVRPTAPAASPPPKGVT